MFDRSVVLVQDSYGHTSLAAGSGCTAGAVRGYFQKGEMPGEGTVCSGDGRPFFEGEGGVIVEGDADMAELIGVMGRLAREWRWGGRGSGYF